LTRYDGIIFRVFAATGHSVGLVNGRRFFAAPRATPSCRYFGRFDRLLEGSAGKTIDFAVDSAPSCYRFGFGGAG
jgi:hypothetical protein